MGPKNISLGRRWEKSFVLGNSWHMSYNGYINCYDEGVEL